MDPSQAVYHNNYGVALHAVGRNAEARRELEQALSLSPEYADAHANLGLVLSSEGQNQQALACLQRALELVPDHRDALFNLANLRHQLGQSDEAIPLYRQLLGKEPQQPEVYNNLGNALLAQKRASEAVACYQQALALNPNYAEAQRNLGTAYAEHDQVPQAAQAFTAAARLRPDKPLWALRSLNLCPTIFPSVEQLEAYRTSLQARLDEAGQRTITAVEADLTYDGFVPSFNLAHHGRGNRLLLEQFAALFRPFIRKRCTQPCAGKPRLGWVVTAPHLGNFLRTQAGLLERFDTKEFDLVVCCSANAVEKCRQGIRRSDIRYVPFPDRFSEAADRIAAAGCSLLCFHKVSADPLSFLLPFARLAPAQYTSWPTHTTSGVAEVDYYVSSALVEVEEADAHYTEKLVRLGTFPIYERRPAPVPPARRCDFGLPQRGHLYLAPQRLAKFHPDQDELFRRVLDADGDGYLVLVADQSKPALQHLLRRFQKTLGSCARRVLVLPPQPFDDYRRLLSLGDALLDIGHYSVSLMGFDALGADLPIVTLPGTYKVERYALGFYRQLHWPEAVTGSPAEYVALAVKLGTDEAFRNHFRTRITAGKDCLFDNQQAVREYERFFHNIVHNIPIPGNQDSAQVPLTNRRF